MKKRCGGQKIEACGLTGGGNEASGHDLISSQAHSDVRRKRGSHGLRLVLVAGGSVCPLGATACLGRRDSGTGR
jgi:hypothetical protein